MRPVNWSTVFVISILLGIFGGYFVVLALKPSLLPPMLRVMSLTHPTTVLFLGTDVVYSTEGRKKLADRHAFNGRSDTIMVARFDPIRNALAILSIPRDTRVEVPGNGAQKINAANAIGGPQLALATVQNLLGIQIDHYVVLNVHGLVDLVNELGGITVEIPKRMKYMDWTAKLKIDLEPGAHTLTGNQAMGFVRFRHDELGDIGRVQRQQIFINAVLDKAMQPSSWSHIPKLVQIGQEYLQTDMSSDELVEVANFVRGVPKKNQSLAMLPGNFSGGGDWQIYSDDVHKMVARFTGASFITPERHAVRVSIENCSSVSGLGYKLSRLLRARGYIVTSVKGAPRERHGSLGKTRIIAQKGNTEEADLVQQDLEGHGDIVAASVGDIESEVTIMAGDDLAPLMSTSK